MLVLELTRHTDALMVPTLLAVAEATVVARLLGAPSIYSARLTTDTDSTGREGEIKALDTTRPEEPGSPATSRDADDPQSPRS